MQDCASSGMDTDVTQGNETRKRHTEQVKNTPTEAQKGCCDGFKKDFGGFRKECHKLRKQAMEIDCRNNCKKICTIENLKGKFPICKWAPKYNVRWMVGDIIAGIAVGLTVIPQGLAYAQIAELPRQYGLYSAFVGCFVYCFFGTSKDIQLGPTAIMSFLTATFAAYTLPSTASDADKEYVLTYVNPVICVVMTLFCGIIQLVMGVFHIGLVVEFISHPVINSFTTAAAITIACSQVKKWLGLTKIPSDFIHQVVGILKNLKKTNLWDFGMGLLCMVTLILLKKMKEKIVIQRTETHMVILKWMIFLVATARNAIVVLVATGIAAAMEHRGYNETLSLTGHIKSGLPPFKPLAFHVNVTLPSDTSEHVLDAAGIFKHIGSGLIIVPILSFVETIAIGKAFARKNKYTLHTNQELIAIGISNILGSFVQAYPVTGSFSRTAVNSQSGVCTPAGQIYTGILVLLALLFLTHLFKYIPQATLAAVIIVAVLDMVDFSLLRKMWKVNKPDLVPWFVTFFLSFILGIEYGILIGCGVNLLMLLFPWVHPGISIEDIIEGNGEVPIVIVRLHQGLRYPGMEYLREELAKAADLYSSKPKHVVLRCNKVTTVDYSTIHGLDEILGEFSVAGTSLVLCDVNEVFAHKILVDGVHIEIFDTLHEAVQSLPINNNFKVTVEVQQNTSVVEGAANLRCESVVAPLTIDGCENGTSPNEEEMIPLNGKKTH